MKKTQPRSSCAILQAAHENLTNKNACVRVTSALRVQSKTDSPCAVCKCGHQSSSCCYRSYLSRLVQTKSWAFLRTTLFLYFVFVSSVLYSHVHVKVCCILCIYSYLASHQTSSSKLFCRRKIANLFQSCTNNFNYSLSGKCLVIFWYILLVARMPQNITGVVHHVKIKQILNF